MRRAGQLGETSYSKRPELESGGDVPSTSRSSSFASSAVIESITKPISPFGTFAFAVGRTVSRIIPIGVCTPSPSAMYNPENGPLLFQSLMSPPPYFDPEHRRSDDVIGMTSCERRPGTLLPIEVLNPCAPFAE